jgi:hypothetical protein
LPDLPDLNGIYARDRVEFFSRALPQEKKEGRAKVSRAERDPADSAITSTH